MDQTASCSFAFSRALPCSMIGLEKSPSNLSTNKNQNRDQSRLSHLRFSALYLKTWTNRDLVTRVIPRLRQFARFCLEFLFVPCDIFPCSNWTMLELWFCFQGNYLICARTTVFKILPNRRSLRYTLLEGVGINSCPQ